ncbi:MAG: transposase, partial [Candidatus Hydrogenedentes bacterium]|nr:transposase [Candidatus Hydrogenedentota bacterium]
GQLFRDLKARGLNGVEMLISDAHEGCTSSTTRRCWKCDGTTRFPRG